MAPKAQVGDATSAFSTLGDHLTKKYRDKAENGSPKECEAATLYLKAEGCLNHDEDYGEALRIASDALALFRGLGDRVAIADTLRLLISTYNCKAENLRYNQGSGAATPVGVTETFDEAERIANEELISFRAAGDQRSVGSMLLALAELNSTRRDFEKRSQAFLSAVEARGLFRELSDEQLEAGASYVLANVYIQKLQAQDALQVANEALSVFRRLSDTKSAAKCLHVIAIAYLTDDMFQDAIEAAKQALHIFRESGSRKLVGFELHNIASWYLAKDKPKEALPYAREAMQLFEELSYSKGWEAASLSLVVQALVEIGDVQQAIKLGKDGFNKFQAAGDVRGKVFALDALAHAQLSKKDQDEALTVVESGLRCCRDLGDKLLEAQMLRTLGMVHSQARDWEKAVEAVQDALALCKEVGDKGEEADACSTLSRIYTAQNDLGSAMAAAEAQRDCYKETGERTKEAFAMLLVANVHGMQADLTTALTLCQEALDMFNEFNHLGGVGGALQLIAELNHAKADYSAGQAAALEMLDIFQEKEDHRMQAQAHLCIAKLKLAEDVSPHDALKAANEALSLVRKIEDKRFQVEILQLICQAHIAVGTKEGEATNSKMARPLRKSAEKALKSAQEALKTALKINEKSLIASSMHKISIAQMVSGRTDAALKTIDEVAPMFAELGDKVGEVACVVLRAEVYTYSGESKKAVEFANKAMAAAKENNDQMAEWRVQQLLQRLQKNGPSTQQQQDMQAPAQTPQAVAVVQETQKTPGLDPAAAEKMVMNIVFNAIGAEEDIHLDSPLMDSGLDSLSSVAFRNDLQKAVGFKIGAALIFDYPTARQIVDHLVESSRTG